MKIKSRLEYLNKLLTHNRPGAVCGADIRREIKELEEELDGSN